MPESLTELNAQRLIGTIMMAALREKRISLPRDQCGSGRAGKGVFRLGAKLGAQALPEIVGEGCRQNSRIRNQLITSRNRCWGDVPVCLGVLEGILLRPMSYDGPRESQVIAEEAQIVDAALVIRVDSFDSGREEGADGFALRGDHGQHQVGVDVLTSALKIGGYQLSGASACHLREQGGEPELLTTEQARLAMPPSGRDAQKTANRFIRTTRFERPSSCARSPIAWSSRAVGQAGPGGTDVLPRSSVRPARPTLGPDAIELRRRWRFDRPDGYGRGRRRFRIRAAWASNSRSSRSFGRAAPVITFSNTLSAHKSRDHHHERA